MFFSDHSRYTSSQSTLTVAYHLDAFTGAIIEPPSSSPNPKDGKVLFDGEPLKTFPLPITHCKTSIRAVAVADPSGSVSDQLRITPPDESDHLIITFLRRSTSSHFAKKLNQVSVT